VELAPYLAIAFWLVSPVEVEAGVARWALLDEESSSSFKLPSIDPIIV